MYNQKFPTSFIGDVNVIYFLKSLLQAKSIELLETQSMPVIVTLIVPSAMATKMKLVMQFKRKSLRVP